jgi:biopolymer transport protein ExbD
MARNFRRHRTAHPIAELNVTNLIDLAFMLLIIFMVVTPLIQQEQTMPMNLPTESKRPQEKPDPTQKFQTIAIDNKGTYYFGTTAIDFDELPGKLEALAHQPKPPVIRIRADWSLQWQKVVKLMDEIKKHQLTKITFDTQTVN